MKTLGAVATIAGLFGLFDAIVDRPTRIRVGEFLFGFHAITARRFERDVVTAVLSPFVRGGRLRRGRVAAASYAATLASMVGVLAVTLAMKGGRTVAEVVADAPAGWLAMADAGSVFGRLAPLAIVLLLCALPLDLFSLWVTKTLFWGRDVSALGSVLLVVVDAVLSSLPFFLAIAAGEAFGLDDGLMEPNPANAVIAVAIAGMLLQYPSTILLTLIQIAVLATAVLVRLLLLLTRLNRWTVLHTRLYEIPLTFVGLVLGAVWAAGWGVPVPEAGPRPAP